MSKQIGSNWDSLSNFFSNKEEKLNILEEEIDLTVQNEYFNIVQELRQNKQEFEHLSSLYIKEIDNLFDEAVDIEIKKRMLVVLANVENISVYRTIETFSKLDTPLKKWAVIALQQSRIVLQSTLLDDPGIFISSGLGGQGKLLRFFCVFFYQNKEALPEFQQQTIYNETEIAIKPYNGTVEQVQYFEEYCTMLLLLPLNVEMKNLFEKIIDECNLYGNFLQKNIIITNIKKLSEQEIAEILQTRKQKSR
ncbi:hypothetical protein [Odoribacter lunatus]|uniref:hypothetical protein n=1 Tax=Odoribacter lunatus TaxID=2941335 RepID=UPI0020403E8F|nr:hypothetical protein [Odoribacter lunatus]